LLLHPLKDIPLMSSNVFCHAANYLCVIFAWKVAQDQSVAFQKMHSVSLVFLGRPVILNGLVRVQPLFELRRPVVLKFFAKYIRGLKMQVSKFGFEGHGTRSKSNALFGNLARSRGRNLAVLPDCCWPLLVQQSQAGNGSFCQETDGQSMN
jgi:hypothetical protein